MKVRPWGDMGELRGESLPQTQRACKDREMLQLEPDGLFGMRMDVLDLLF